MFHVKHSVEYEMKLFRYFYKKYGLAGYIFVKMFHVKHMDFIVEV